MDSNIKIGLIVILVGIIVLGIMGLFYLFRFLLNTLYILLLFSILILGVGINFTYKELSHLGKGIMLNISGVASVGFTALMIFLIDVWMDSSITLIVIFAILWFLVLNVPGLYKTIKQDNFPDLYKILDGVIIIITSVVLVITIIMAAIYKQNFSEHYFPNFGVILLASILIPAIFAFLVWVGYQTRFH